MPDFYLDFVSYYIARINLKFVAAARTVLELLEGSRNRLDITKPERRSALGSDFSREQDR
jgi:hypothetical protein